MWMGDFLRRPEPCLLYTSGTLYVAGAFGAANGWNPLGWVVLGTVAVLCIVALAVSYTHLDVYKRQVLMYLSRGLLCGNMPVLL